jgi:hypothetical protein
MQLGATNTPLRPGCAQSPALHVPNEPQSRSAISGTRLRTMTAQIRIPEPNAESPVEATALW